MTYQTTCERQETSNFWRQMLATRHQRRRLLSLQLKWRRTEAEIWSTKKTKLNDSADLKGAGLEYRRKGHWELEAKNQQVKLTTVTRNKVSGKTWIEELNFRLAELSDEKKKKLLKTLVGYINDQTQEMYKLDVDRQKLLGHLSIISTEEVVLNSTWNWWDRRHA